MKFLNCSLSFLNCSLTNSQKFQVQTRMIPANCFRQPQTFTCPDSFQFSWKSTIPVIWRESLCRSSKWWKISLLCMFVTTRDVICQSLIQRFCMRTLPKFIYWKRNEISNILIKFFKFKMVKFFNQFQLTFWNKI